MTECFHMDTLRIWFGNQESLVGKSGLSAYPATSHWNCFQLFFHQMGNRSSPSLKMYLYFQYILLLNNCNRCGFAKESWKVQFGAIKKSLLMVFNTLPRTTLCGVDMLCVACVAALWKCLVPKYHLSIFLPLQNFP